MRIIKHPDNTNAQRSIFLFSRLRVNSLKLWPKVNNTHNKSRQQRASVENPFSFGSCPDTTRRSASHNCFFNFVKGQRSQSAIQYSYSTLLNIYSSLTVGHWPNAWVGRCWETNAISRAGLSHVCAYGKCRNSENVTCDMFSRGALEFSLTVKETTTLLTYSSPNCKTSKNKTKIPSILAHLIIRLLFTCM